MSHNVCYLKKNEPVPLVFNDDKNTAVVQTVTLENYRGRFIGRIYHLDGRYWFTISGNWFQPCSSFPFVSLRNCVRSFESECVSRGWSLVLVQLGVLGL